jgi:hypothetical protein
MPRRLRRSVVKKIADYQIIQHGVNHESYFEGCGVALTPYTDVATGIGDTAEEALGDALDQLAQGGWDTSSIKDHLDDVETIDDWMEDNGEDPEEEHRDDPLGIWFYVSVRVKEEDQ